MFWNFDGAVSKKFRGVDAETGGIIYGSYIRPLKSTPSSAKILVDDYHNRKREERNVFWDSVEQCAGIDPLFNEVYENDVVVDKNGLEYDVKICAVAVSRDSGEVVDINDLDYDFRLK